MKNLIIGRILAENRRKRGITQEALAEYMGVSKASVSKWETSTTYPDITLLPRLASFFHISIDELMGYEPQMSKEEIRSLYRQLAHDFTVKPFDQVLNRCQEIAQNYFSCESLLFHIGSLYVNHCSRAETPEKTEAVLDRAIELFRRVRLEGDDVSLKNQALHMEAACLLQLGRGEEALKLLPASVHLRMTPELLQASAFQITGRSQEAACVLQLGIYQTAIELIQLLLSYLGSCQGSPAAFEETCRRTLALADVFHLETLHPTILLNAYLTIAQHLAVSEKPEKALELLERYASLAASDIYPLRLHGDSYFTHLEKWIEETFPLGSDLPRNEAAVRESIVKAVAANPAFDKLHQNKRFQAILHRLESWYKEIPV